jgi:hypothetical protein
VSNAPSSAPASTFAHAKADQRPLELGPGALLVGRGSRARREDLLGAIAGLLRAARVNLLGVLGRICEDDHAVAANVHESAEHRKYFLDTAALHPELTWPKRGEERSVVREDPDVSLARGSDDHVDVILVDLPLGRDDFEVKRH